MKKYLQFFLLIPMIAVSQTQIGQKIEGVSNGGTFGTSASISTDGSVIAVGAPTNNDNGSLSGHVRIYQNTNNIWTQIGNDIQGVGATNRCGESISLSSDGSVVAIGSPFQSSSTGHVRVFENVSGSWVQVGQDIVGDAIVNYSGIAVSMSADGKIIAIGAPENDGNGSNSGVVKIFENVAGVWTQLGQNIQGDAPNDRFGQYVKLSRDGSTVAASSVFNSTNGSSSGHTKVFKNISGVWTQVGQNINGESSNNQSGTGISLSENGDIIAVGAPNQAANGNFMAGVVKIYENVNGAWSQVGQNIIGDNEYDGNGFRIELSNDGMVLVTTSLGDSTQNYNSGAVRVFRNIANVWTLVSTIYGEGAQDQFGMALALTPDASKLIIGAPQAGAGGNVFTKGYAKVYDLSGVLSTKKINAVNFNVYPNPSSDVLNIELDDNAVLENVTIYNNLGQKIKSAKTIVVDVSNLAKGLYFVEVTTNIGKADQKVIIK